ncbi:hypothetical protein [Streptomyces chartreusis]
MDLIVHTHSACDGVSQEEGITRLAPPPEGHLRSAIAIKIHL